jgi:hypothetical protein
MSLAPARLRPHGMHAYAPKPPNGPTPKGEIPKPPNPPPPAGTISIPATSGTEPAAGVADAASAGRDENSTAPPKKAATATPAAAVAVVATTRGLLPSLDRTIHMEVLRDEAPRPR